MKRIALQSTSARSLALFGLVALVLGCVSHADAVPQINVQVGDDGDSSGLPLTLKIVLLMTVLSLAPALAVLVTSFTRIVIVFSFLKVFFDRPFLVVLVNERTPPRQFEIMI